MTENFKNKRKMNALPTPKVHAVVATAAVYIPPPLCQDLDYDVCVGSRKDGKLTAFGGIEGFPPDLRVVPAGGVVDVEVAFYLHVGASLVNCALRLLEGCG